MKCSIFKQMKDDTKLLYEESYFYMTLHKAIVFQYRFIDFRNGPEWWRLRKEFQKLTSKPQDVINYLEETDCVAREFVELCDKEKYEDFLPILSRLFLECNQTLVLQIVIK